MDLNTVTLEYRGFISGNLPIMLKVEYEKYNPENISTQLILLSSDEGIAKDFRESLNGDTSGNLRITGEKDSDPEILIRNITGWSHHGNRANLFIGGFEYAISETPTENTEKIYVTVELTPSSILKKWGSIGLHYDGNIKHEYGYPEQIEWDLNIGKGTAFTRYTYEEHSVFDNKATIQIARPSLIFEIGQGSGFSIGEIKNEVEREAQDVSLLLSLCYRKLVNWYEINFGAVQRRDNVRAVYPLTRRKIFNHTYSEHEDELINHRDLIGGGLPRLVANFRASPLNESLRRTMTFLATSQANQTIEVKYFLSIISLESFCDGLIDLDQAKVKIPSGKWKRIEKTLRSSLEPLSGQQDMMEYIGRVRRKLPELKGVTTLDKILHCCTALKIDADDLWRKDGFEAGLKKALSMRNHLFHRAYYEDPYFLYANCVRIQVLTERLLLKHLGWPDEKIWRWYDQKIRRVKIDEQRDT